MKIPIKKILLYSGLVLLGLVVVFLVCRTLLHLDDVGAAISGIAGSLRAIILGCVMAYLLYPLTRFTEQLLLYYRVKESGQSPLHRLFHLRSAGPDRSVCLYRHSPAGLQCAAAGAEPAQHDAGSSPRTSLISWWPTGSRRIS